LRITPEEKENAIGTPGSMANDTAEKIVLVVHDAS
jgi:hypothetical protein